MVGGAAGAAEGWEDGAGIKEGGQGGAGAKGGGAGTKAGEEGGAGAKEDEEGGAVTEKGGDGETEVLGTAGAGPIEAKGNKRNKKLSNVWIKLSNRTIKSYLPETSLQLELEVLELQEERRDLLATEQEVMVLQLAEYRLQRM